MQTGRCECASTTYRDMESVGVLTSLVRPPHVAKSEDREAMEMGMGQMQKNFMEGDDTPRRFRESAVSRAKSVIQPRRVICLSAFLALIWFGTFFINSLTGFLLELSKNESLLSKLDGMFIASANNMTARGE